MTTPQQDEILSVLGTMLIEVIAEEWAQDFAFTMDTSFSEDLELESIEFVALAERVQTHFGDQVDFVNWLSSMEIDAIISLSLGQLVEFIEQCLNA